MVSQACYDHCQPEEFVSQSGSNVSVTNVSYNGTIAPGGTVNFGFNGSWNGSNPAPTSFTLNGQTC